MEFFLSTSQYFIKTKCLQHNLLQITDKRTVKKKIPNIFKTVQNDLDSFCL